MDGSNQGWKLEAWKAMVAFCEKLFLLSAGALLVPVVIGKVKYATIAFVLGGSGAALFGVVWLLLVLKGYFKEESK